MSIEPLRVNEALVEIGDKVRVEAGPEMLTAIATETLLADDATASHYKVGRKDKLGRTIQIGQEMAYLDWLSPNVFHLYELSTEDETVELEGGPEIQSVTRWRRRGFYRSETEALAAGVALAEAIAGA
jgi:hypothetical protein